MPLSLYVLGPFLATSAQHPLTELTARKPQALLAYLAVEASRPHYRETLAGLFWPDRPERSALGSLRQALVDLRRAGGAGPAAPPLLLASRETIRLNPEAGCWLDAAVFARKLSAGGAPGPAIEDLQAAIALYRGSFMEGFSLSDSPAFEEWLLLKREQFGRQMLGALSSLAALHEGRRDFEAALACARRIIDMEPWREDAHRQAMRLLALLSRRGEALAQYRQCRELLARELGTEPEPETITLCDRIRDGALPAGSASASDTQAPVPELLRASATGASFRRPPTTEPERGTLLVAREQELAQLDGLLAQALAGQGRVALITGEAGSGKTALVKAFCRQSMAAHGELLIALGRCSARGGSGDTYQPWREIVSMLAGNPEGGSMPDALGREHVSRLQTALPAMLEALACEGPGLLRLMANDHSLAARAQACAPAGAPWLARLQALAAQQAAPGAPGLQESALCEQTARVLGAIARCRPLLLLLDDLQWADTPSLDMLFYLGRHLEAKRILILGAYRPGEPGLHPLAAIANEFQRQWGDIRVDLAQVDARRFVDAYLDSWPNRFGAPFREALARHTASNALFTVELVQAMQQRGDLRRDATGRWIEGSSLAWEQLPPRVEGAIAQRIGQLTAAQQELLETASVEGEDFCAEVLARVRGLPEDAVIAALSGPLGRQAGLVAPHGLVPLGDRVLSRYRFHHALFQSYLYGRLDRATRAHLHGATADALEALYGEQAPQLAGQLARHYEEAGRADKAARYLLDAGRQAAQVGAHGEAIGCFERALGLLEDIPGAAPLTELEFLLQTALDSSLLARGWATAARLRASGRAYELGRATGQTGPAVLYALWRLGILYGARGNFARAIELAGELLAAARAAQDALHITAAHALFARCHLLQGEFVQARRHLDQAGPLHAEQGQPAPEGALLIWVNVEISAAFTQWALGYPDQAQHHIERALAYPGGPPDLFAIAYARSMAATFYAMRHQDHLAQQWAERVASANTGEELLELQSWSAQILGWVEARAGRKPQGIARIVEAMGTPQAQGTEALRYNWLAFLAEAYLANGEIRPARQIVEKALAELDDQTRYYQAELWRLRGEAALGTGAPSEAEVYFQQAIAIARRQEARAWELRATVSLARLWQAQGRREEGREMLAGIYGWFTEGFDTADLREAKALLDALHSARN